MPRVTMLVYSQERYLFRWLKNTSSGSPNRGTPPEGLWWVACAKWGRKRLDNSDMRPVIWGFKTGQCARWKEKSQSQGQYGTVMPIARAIRNTTVRPFSAEIAVCL
jgi:hypothetical protein